MRRVPLEHLVPRLDPLELAGELRPEGFRVLVGLLVNRGVGDVRGADELSGRGELAVFFQERVDLFLVGLVGHGGTTLSRSMGAWVHGSMGP